MCRGAVPSECGGEISRLALSWWRLGRFYAGCQNRCHGSRSGLKCVLEYVIFWVRGCACTPDLSVGYGTFASFACAQDRRSEKPRLIPCDKLPYYDIQQKQGVGGVSTGQSLAELRNWAMFVPDFIL